MNLSPCCGRRMSSGLRIVLIGEVNKRKIVGAGPKGEVFKDESLYATISVAVDILGYCPKLDLKNGLGYPQYQEGKPLEILIMEI